MAAFLLAAYSNSFHVPFTFDDHPNIVDNPLVKLRVLSFETLTAAATKSLSGHRWLPNISFALNYYFGGLNVWGYHLLNLAIHILTAVVFYKLAFVTLTLPVFQHRFKNSREIALAAALVWAVHPLQTNAVTYIVQRMTSMAALFCLSGLLFYVHGRLQTPSRRRYTLYGSSLLCGIPHGHRTLAALELFPLHKCGPERTGGSIEVRKCSAAVIKK